jgi:hypothetical protein
VPKAVFVLHQSAAQADRDHRLESQAIVVFSFRQYYFPDQSGRGETLQETGHKRKDVNETFSLD